MDRRQRRDPRDDRQRKDQQASALGPAVPPCQPPRPGMEQRGQEVSGKGTITGTHAGTVSKSCGTLASAANLTNGSFAHEVLRFGFPMLVASIQAATSICQSLLASRYPPLHGLIESSLDS